MDKNDMKVSNYGWLSDITLQ